MQVIHYFNPGHENAVLNRLPSYTPPSSMVRLMRELASLPAWYAKPDEVVLVGDSFDMSYHEDLAFLNICVSKIHDNSELCKYNELLVCLWGIAPNALRFFESLGKKQTLQFCLPEWSEKYIYWNSRKFSNDVLKNMQCAISTFDCLTLPAFYSDIESIELLFNNTLTGLLVKSPYSSSGRGLLWLTGEKLLQSAKQILQGMLNRQGEVSVEPIYDKVLDFAMEFMSDGCGVISFVGYSLFVTNEKGAYQGNLLISQQEICARLCSYVDNSILTETKLMLEKLLSDACSSVYKGCIGVDMMIYSDEINHKIHPCVEINMRYNMGYLATKLYENHISDCSQGVFNIDFDLAGKVLREHEVMKKQYPLIVGNGGKVRSGYLSLCPVDENTSYRAYILVEEL